MFCEIVPHHIRPKRLYRMDTKFETEKRHTDNPNCGIEIAKFVGIESMIAERKKSVRDTIHTFFLFSIKCSYMYYDCIPLNCTRSCLPSTFFLFFVWVHNTILRQTYNQNIKINRQTFSSFYCHLDWLYSISLIWEICFTKSLPNYQSLIWLLIKKTPLAFMNCFVRFFFQLSLSLTKFSTLLALKEAADS